MSIVSDLYKLSWLSFSPCLNPFLPTVPTCAVRETAPLGIFGAPEVPPLCRETQSLGQQMLELSCENATVGKNGLSSIHILYAEGLTQQDRYLKMIFDMIKVIYYQTIKCTNQHGSRLKYPGDCSSLMVRIVTVLAI